MRQFKLLLLAALAVMSIGAISAAAANAESLASILWLTTGESVVKGSIGNGTAVVAQFNSTFAKITAKKLSVTLTGAAGGMADLGPAKIDFEGSELSGHKCFTEGDSLEAAVVLIAGAEWHVVLAESKYMLLILVPETSIKCDGSITFKSRGDVLNLALSGGSPVSSGKEYSAINGDTECEAVGSRKAKWKTFSNHEGTATTAKLEGNGGLGFEEVCEEVKGEFEFAAEPAIEFMEP